MTRLLSLLPLSLLVSCEGVNEFLSSPEASEAGSEVVSTAVETVASGGLSGDTMSQVGAGSAVVVVGAVLEFLRRKRKKLKEAAS